jgi:hypothetical protein
MHPVPSWDPNGRQRTCQAPAAFRLQRIQCAAYQLGCFARRLENLPIKQVSGLFDFYTSCHTDFMGLAAWLRHSSPQFSHEEGIGSQALPTSSLVGRYYLRKLTECRPWRIWLLVVESRRSERPSCHGFYPILVGETEILPLTVANGS